MLPPESPVLYGLHANAEIGVLTTMADYLFNTILELEPKNSSGGGGEGVTREEKVRFSFSNKSYCYLGLKTFQAIIADCSNLL